MTRSLRAVLGTCMIASCTALALIPSHVLHAQANTDPLHDLPLVEVPTPANISAAATQSAAGHTLVIMLSGDGDWASLVKGIANSLTHAGAAVIGLKARSYLAQGSRTPDGTAHDVERMAREYMKRWGRDRLAIMGYSRGADMAPFVASRLPADLRAKLTVVGMYGLAEYASFEFHWADLVKDARRPTDIATRPELERIRGTPMFCVFGTDETDSPCRNIDQALVRSYPRSGAHHFDGDVDALGALAVEAVSHEH